MRELSNDQVVPQIVSEIVELEADCVAIAAVMVMKDGTICTRRAYMEGHKLPLLAGVSLQHNDFCRDISDEPRNFVKARR